MRQASVRKTARRPARSSRPATIKTAGRRKCDVRELLGMLREQLDLGHPTKEAAADILRVARALNRVDVPKTYRSRAIRYLQDLDKSRDVLGWDSLQEQLHDLLQSLITRLQHTHTPRPRVRSLHLPTADKIPPPRRRRAR